MPLPTLRNELFEILIKCHENNTRKMIFASWELESQKCSVRRHSLLHVIFYYFYRSWWVNGKTSRDRYSFCSPSASTRNTRYLYYVAKYYSYYCKNWENKQTCIRQMTLTLLLRVLRTKTNSCTVITLNKNAN